jgi:LIVCS family branched-chain amino acid:cation transporter
MSGLFIIYAGLIALGALYGSEFASNITRTELLSGLSVRTLGNKGSILLSVLVGLACFTTAVGVIVGTADFFAGLFKDSKRAYTITAIASCIIGIVIGQLNVKYIIDVALPALMFIYPLTIVLILLNLVPDKYAPKIVFKMVILVAFVFSIPDFLGHLVPAERLEGIKHLIPLSQYNLGWVLPALVTFLLVNLIRRSKNPT